jgi:hypothetical protein
MYALLYDEHRLDRPQKRVISVHDSREAAEVALDERRERLGRKVWECYTRIVWTAKEVNSGDFLGPGEYRAWRSGERVPEGEIYADTD